MTATLYAPVVGTRRGSSRDRWAAAVFFSRTRLWSALAWACARRCGVSVTALFAGGVGVGRAAVLVERRRGVRRLPVVAVLDLPDGVAVGGEVAGEPEGLPGQVVHQLHAGRGRHPVDLVVRAHDRRRVGLLD